MLSDPEGGLHTGDEQVGGVEVVVEAALHALAEDAPEGLRGHRLEGRGIGPGYIRTATQLEID